ncbi:hypothetical protein [Halomonas sp. LBP4]|uniref:hypothetical protein n=1 Tax=Halomonas sp. LBP4 TaxID=2044917 RepID=UPI000D750F6E|nr:hypothetical protein [Halomonas sp. LBP4]PXX95929.1 hypothetical protein CR157_17175 [Halomonas sp. LBP4]
MALDTAIKNVGDYYAAHYLADKNGFAKDIRDLAKAWKEQGSQSAPRRLAALGDSYFKAKTAALDFPEPELRSRAGVKELDAWHPALLDALGYRPEPFALELATEKKQLPALLRLNRHNRPWLVTLQAPFCLSGGDSDEEPLEQEVQAPGRLVEELPTLQESWEKAIANLFKQEDAPRWVMLLAGARVYLFDAQTYAQGRYLWIDLEEAYGRRQAETFQAICALLSVEALSPQGESDEVLHERLREGSLKSTHGVSEKLQGAVRDAIQAIANGWVEARRQSNLGYRQLSEREAPLPDGSREITAEQLRHDALIYVYRLLFCFYAEARGGELGILPINDDVYRLGYSLEALRDLVDANEPGTTTEQGTYIAEHLEWLFQLIYEGFDPAREGLAQEEESDGPQFGRLPSQESLFGSPSGEQLALEDAQPRQADSRRDGYTPGKLFAIEPLTATLFDPAATPLLSRVKLPNRVLHGVIRSLSLGTSQQSRRIGRINYAELGIVQLGSVYEGLLSYKGFFATEDLIQVHQQIKQGRTIKSMLDNAVDPKQPTWFVPATRLDEFKKGEVVLEHRTQKPRIYRTGEFILHLNGVDRVNSASYYTPEVLTRTLVEEALKERLKDFTPEQADEVLALKVCEPAMGSAAFLVEAIDQLAHRYLELKQQQLGQSIDPSDYEDELRRVRHYIAVHNVYGVDLNPVAVELGALSLWLATIHRLMEHPGSEDTPPVHRPAATPWFGLRLRAGNSLIGARRSVWSKVQLGAGKHYGKNAHVPRQLKPGEARKPGEIYHFLVWDEEMAPAATDKLMRQHWPEECEQIKQWRNKQVKQTISPEELARLEALSARIDVLWADYAAERHRALAHSACTASVWPTPQNDVEALRPGPSLRHQERLKARLEAESGAFQRLRLLMDSWCSFYFWPLEQAEALPSREAWLAAAEVLLGIGTDDLATRAMLDIQLGEDIDLEALFQASQAQLPDAAHLSELVPWFGVGRATANEQHYHHWELIFTEILGPRVEDKPEPKGFDLMFGNPPWLKVAWNKEYVLYEIEPLLGVQAAGADELNEQLEYVFDNVIGARKYVQGVTSSLGGQKFLGERKYYPDSSGVKANLYKKFIEEAWRLVAAAGVSGILCPDEFLSDSKGGRFRERFYAHVVKHFQFNNEVGVFADVHNQMTFSINVMRSSRGEVEFDAIFNLFEPKTIAACYNDDGKGVVPGIKDAKGDWEISGHLRRVVRITKKELGLFSRLFEEEGGGGCKLPKLHSEDFVPVLEKFSKFKLKLADGYLKSSVMFDETAMQKKGVLSKDRKPTYESKVASEFVVSGPHYYVANPYHQNANTIYESNRSYHSLDLINLPKSPKRRSLFRLGDKVGGMSNFQKEVLARGLGEDYIGRYRYLNREMAKSGNERTLMPVIIPPGVIHLITSFGISFSDLRKLALYTAGNISIVHDFFIKVSGTGHCYGIFLERMPVYEGEAANSLISRCLRLICLSEDYAPLWNSVYDSSIPEGWTVEDPCLNNAHEKSWGDLGGWDMYSPLRLCFSRRQALIEIDVLVALSLGVSIEALINAYSVQFPVMKAYEEADEYDSLGQRLPNTKRKDAGGKEVREARTDHDGTSPLTVSWDIDNGYQTVTRTFYPPFRHVDRIEDYRTAYRVFAERLGIGVPEAEASAMAE